MKRVLCFFFVFQFYVDNATQPVFVIGLLEKKRIQMALQHLRLDMSSSGFVFHVCFDCLF